MKCVPGEQTKKIEEFVPLVPRMIWMLSPAVILAWMAVELLVPGITRSEMGGENANSPSDFNKITHERRGREKWKSHVPVVVTIFCTYTPAFCRQLTGNPPRLDAAEVSVGAEPEDA